MGPTSKVGEWVLKNISFVKKHHGHKAYSSHSPEWGVIF
jgi:hypothetical protein